MSQPEKTPSACQCSCDCSDKDARIAELELALSHLTTFVSAGVEQRMFLPPFALTRARAVLADNDPAGQPTRSRISDLEAALRLALPQLDANFRWHRDAQSAPSNVIAAHDALRAARAVLGEPPTP
jgi:hypothetical protein